MKSGIELITAERQRQIESEGWSPEHDDEHIRGEIAFAAFCYAKVAALQEDMKVYAVPASQPREWPWAAHWWKPSDNPIRNLEKAGALIAAEIDRLKRKTDHE